MQFQRQHPLLSHSKSLSVGPARVENKTSRITARCSSHRAITCPILIGCDKTREEGWRSGESARLPPRFSTLLKNQHFQIPIRSGLLSALCHEPLARVIAQALPVFDIKFAFTFFFLHKRSEIVRYFQGRLHDKKGLLCSKLSDFFLNYFKLVSSRF